MKIVRFLSGGQVKIGQWVDTRSAKLIEGDLLGSYRVTDQVATIDQLLAPIVPRDILCIGVNYRAHAAETGSQLPKNPMLFIKASGTLNDPFGKVVVPSNSKSVDYEAELCVIIGKTAKHVSRETALDYVFGYTCANDVSARDWQRDKELGGGQFARGKSFDGFCPLGPWIVTRDEIPNPNALTIKCFVNGEERQNSTTADMVFDVPTLISSLSSTLTLHPGAVILTGTPSGVAMGRTPSPWLKPGDAVRVEVEKIGVLENTFVEEK